MEIINSWQVDGGKLNGSLNGEMLEEVDHFKYLGSQIGMEGGVEVDVSIRVGEARRAAGTVRKLWKNGGLGVEANMMLYEGVVVSTALCEAGIWAWEKQRGGSWMILRWGVWGICVDWQCGTEVMRKWGGEHRWKGSYLVRVDQWVRRWFKHVEKMDEKLMAKIMISDAEGNRCRGRPRLGWMDGVRMTLGERGTPVEQGRLNVWDRRWELIVSSVKMWSICMCFYMQW